MDCEAVSLLHIPYAEAFLSRFPFCVTGTHLLNKCPKVFSCGSLYAIWTDEDTPKDIGVPTNVTAYGSSSYDYSSRCKEFTIEVEMMRCSLIDHDFIYRHINNSAHGTKYFSGCAFAFCGML